jgi:hypothetical protein
VILRAIRGRASRDELEALRAALDQTLGNGAGEQLGPARFHLAARPSRDGADQSGDLEAILISFWSSAEAAASGDEREVSPLSVAQRHLRDLSVEHFEIDETFLRHSDVQPIAIRLATGRFSRHGADVEMQQLLRERAPSIGDEMTEAYVGRRLAGRAVEVTFVSAWSSLPTDHPLEQAFWPDIALRYDEFVVEVYAAVGVQ